MLYSKLGSIPKPETDGTEGWIEVNDPPEAGEGQEVVWWYPPGWIVRSIKPTATETTDYSWSQSEERWIEYAIVRLETSQTIQQEVVSNSSNDSNQIVG